MDPSFEIRGGKAFTEDKILIFNIKAIEIPKNATVSEIAKYFKKFGKVLNVRELERKEITCPPEFMKVVEEILQKNNIKMERGKDYVIAYSNPRAAARVLRKPLHRFKNQNIQVEPCLSIEQPDGQKLIEQMNKNFAIDSMANFDNGCNKQNDEAHILNLNDDCLEHLFRFLNLSDQINLALSCQRFATVLSLFSKAQLKNFDINSMRGLTLFQMRIYLQIVGPQIKKLRADVRYLDFEMDCEMELFPFLGSFCTNVEKLKVIENSSKTLCKLVEKMHLLEEIELIRASFDPELIKYLQNCKNLKTLNVISNSVLTGSEIPKLTGLEKLTLYSCPEVMSQFKDICKSLTNLSYLDIRCNTYNKFLDTEDYEHIAKYLLQLKTLKIAVKNGNCNSIATLPKLTNLEIVFTDLENTDNFFKHLAEHQANQLEELTINAVIFEVEAAAAVAKLNKLKIFRCRFAIDDEIIEEISKSKELEEIEFFETTEFTDDGILKLLENALKLKHICFRCSMDEQDTLIPASHKFLEKQRDLNRRTGCVNFVFRGYAMTFEKTSDKYEYSDVLKITEHFENGEDLDDFYDDDYAHGGDDDGEDDFMYHSDYEDDDDDYYYNNFWYDGYSDSSDDEDYLFFN